jgi:hypothetical protein
VVRSKSVSSKGRGMFRQTESNRACRSVQLHAKSPRPDGTLMPLILYDEDDFLEYVVFLWCTNSFRHTDTYRIVQVYATFSRKTGSRTSRKGERVNRKDCFDNLTIRLINHSVD